ncbi:sel1 repeat family protein [Psychrosphaera sp.]|nr:sel1 repeat family protein [Psychrosphaera sp.]
MKTFFLALILTLSFQVKSDTFEIVDFCKSDCAAEKNQLKRLAKEGSGLAKVALGIMYIDGTGGEPEINKGLNHLRTALRQNEPSAIFQMGHFYHRGLYIEQDRELALKLYEKAVKLKVPEAKEQYKILKAELKLEQNVENAIADSQASGASSTLALEQVHKSAVNKNKSVRKMERIRISRRISFDHVISAANSQTCTPGMSCPFPWRWVNMPLIIEDAKT